MSDIALRRVGFGPQIRSSVHQLHCAKCATAHWAHTKGWPLRTLLVLNDNKGDFVFDMCLFFYGSVRAHDGVHCRGLWTEAGAWCYDDRALTLRPSMYFLALCEHRRLSLPWCVWRVDGECNLTDDFVNGYLEAVAPAAPKPKAACCKHSMGLEVDLGYRCATRYGPRELRRVVLVCNALLSVVQAPAIRNVGSRPCAGDAFDCM